MNENRQKVAPVTDLLEYKIRVGEISNEGGHEIFHIALKHVELVDQIVYILYFCSKMSRIMELEIFSLAFSDLTGSSESALVSSAAS